MKSKLNFNLANQVLAGYAVIIMVAVVASFFCIASLRSNQEIDRRITQTYLPFYLNLKELNALAAEMGKLTNNWVYQPNADDKKKLISLLSERYPQLSKEIESIIATSDDVGMDSVKSVLATLTQITSNEKQVTQLLNADSLYSNDLVIDHTIQLVDKSIMPQIVLLDKTLKVIIEFQKQKMAQAQAEKEQSYFSLKLLLIFMIVAFIITTVAAYTNVRRRIVIPIIKIKDALVELGKGKIIMMDAQQRLDEIGQMHNTMANLASGISAKSIFAEQIGNGKYEEHFNLLSEEDSMGKALLTMRDNLKRNTEEDRKRNWANEGLAKLGTILRNQDEEIEKFGDRVLLFTVKYTGSNQGSLYIVNDDIKGQEYLEMISCYAWEKKKHLHAKIERSEGLTGQCWQEREPIYMTQVPDNYIKISSGLGLANPRNIFIIPLKVNEEVLGIIELASFKILEDHERELIMKLAENLGAAIGAVKVNHKTKMLLTQTQQQAEEMRSQEEEMRQNMEEMTATQEEISRKEQEYLKKIAELQAK